MRKLLIIFGIILVLIIASFIVYNAIPKDITQMDDNQFKRYNLKQSEVKEAIGNEPVIQTTITPLTSFNQENYDILVKSKPECLSEVNFGDTIKTATFYTPTREIGILWVVKKNKLICVASRAK